MRKLFVLIVALISLVSTTSQANNDALDIQAELSRPGVKLVVVEFYATWCKPCMEAVPKWKALHKKYKKAGLRFIVVSADEGVCSKPPEWAPDETLCDPDGALQRKMGVKSLPTSFLYSWEGKLAMKSHHVKPVDEAIQSYFRDTHYKLNVEPVVVIGDKYAVSGNPERVRDEVVAKLRQKSKIDVVSERKTATRRGQADMCSVEFPPNSTLRIKLLGYETGERMLSLELEKDGCTKAQSTQPYDGEGFHEDWASLKRAIARAVDALLVQIIRVRAPELIGGGVPSDNEDWFTESDLVLVNFGSNPLEATVLVDNKPACDDTPCSRSFSKGRHTITMIKANYATRTETIDLQTDRTIHWELVPNFGWLTINGLPEGLDVKIDKTPAIQTPISRHQLAPGRHHIRIDSRCYYPLESTQTIKRNKETIWRPSIRPREAGLDVRAVDADGNEVRADVFVDDVKIGQAPGRFKVNVCASRLTVKMKGFRDFPETLNLEEKKITKIQANLDHTRIVDTDYLAKQAFYKIQSEFEDFTAIKLEVNDSTLSKEEWTKRLDEAITRKARVLFDISRKYLEVIKYGSSEWTVASYCRLGQLQQNYVDSLLESEVPYWLTQKERDKYKEDMSKRARRMWEGALRSYKECIDAAREGGVAYENPFYEIARRAYRKPPKKYSR